MNTRTDFSKIFMLIGGVVLVLAIIAGVVIQQAQHSQAALTTYGTVPEFTFANQDGEDFGTEQMEGKITVLDFFFINCQGPCPLMSTEMKALYDQYSATDEIQFVSVSVDPARDSLAALQEYRSRYGVTDHRWNFLYAPIEEVRDLSVNGFMLGGDFPMGHSTRFVLIDSQNRIRGYYSSLEDASMDVLRNHIRVLAQQS